MLQGFERSLRTWRKFQRMANPHTECIQCTSCGSIGRHGHDFKRARQLHVWHNSLCSQLRMLVDNPSKNRKPDIDRSWIFHQERKPPSQLWTLWSQKWRWVIGSNLVCKYTPKFTLTSSGGCMCRKMFRSTEHIYSWLRYEVKCCNSRAITFTWLQ